METLSGKPISKIGIGSYGIGGRGHRDVDITEKKEDKQYIDALVYILKNTPNFTEISLGYGHGQALLLFKKAFDKSSIVREDFFLTHSLYLKDLSTPEVMKNDVNDFYKIMETDYADSTLITQSVVVQFGKENVYPLLHQLLETGKTRYVSLSNADSNFIKTFKKEFGDKFITHEGHLSFEIRALQDEGIFDVCNELGVTNIIWRPLRRNLTIGQNWQLLTELSAKYQKSQNQIILNWICKLGYHPMVMSANIEHINENLASTNFQMSAEDYERMTNFRPPNYHPPDNAWKENGKGDLIVELVKDFEKHIH